MIKRKIKMDERQNRNRSVYASGAEAPSGSAGTLGETRAKMGEWGVKE
jgi:hypothetical protein